MNAQTTPASGRPTHIALIDLALEWDIEAESDGEFIRRAIRLIFDQMDVAYAAYDEGQQGIAPLLPPSVQVIRAEDDTVAALRYERELATATPHVLDGAPFGGPEQLPDGAIKDSLRDDPAIAEGLRRTEDAANAYVRDVAAKIDPFDR